MCAPAISLRIMCAQALKSTCCSSFPATAIISVLAGLLRFTPAPKCSRKAKGSCATCLSCLIMLCHRMKRLAKRPPFEYLFAHVQPRLLVLLSQDNLSHETLLEQRFVVKILYRSTLVRGVMAYHGVSRRILTCHGLSIPYRSVGLPCALLSCARATPCHTLSCFVRWPCCPP